jgi:hypothetical protein
MTFTVHALGEESISDQFGVPKTLDELFEVFMLVSNAYGVAATHTAVIYVERVDSYPKVATLGDFVDGGDYLVEFREKKGEL